MLSNVDWIKEKYQEFNAKYFGGQLPNIAFKTSNDKKRWGYASYRFNLSSGELTPVSITISNYYDSPEEVKVNTLLHEMIHIEDYTLHPEHFVTRDYSWRSRFQYKKRRGYDAHGEWFLAEAERINGYGFHVAAYVQDWEISQSQLSQSNKDLLSKKMKDGAIIGFLRCIPSEKGLDRWFYLKTNARGMKTLLAHVLGDIWNKIAYTKVEWYKTYDERWVGERNQLKQLAGWYCDSAKKDEIIKNGEMQLVKTDIIQDAEFIGKEIALCAHRLLDNIRLNRMDTRSYIKILYTYLWIEVDQAEGGGERIVRFTIQPTKNTSGGVVAEFPYDEIMEDSKNWTAFEDKYSMMFYDKVKSLGYIEESKKKMDIRKLIREILDEYMEAERADDDMSSNDPMRNVKQISDDEFIESIV